LKIAFYHKFVVTLSKICLIMFCKCGPWSGNYQIKSILSKDTAAQVTMMSLQLNQRR